MGQYGVHEPMPTPMSSRRDFLRETLPGGRVAVLVAAVVAAHLAAAWYNAGFLNVDEHYQIIEFAQYKLGYQRESALAWEFPLRLRPALQPWVATIAIRANHALGLTSPFTIAFSLRLLSSVLAMAVSFELCRRCLRSASRSARQAALFMSFLLWIAPTVHGRFSSENWSGLWFAAGLCLILDALDDGPHRAKSAILAAAGGLLWAVAFYSRFQMAIAIVGAVLWLLLVRRRSTVAVAAIALSFAVGCGLNEVLDRWLYGVWTSVPLNYFDVNLIQGKAATYGTAPWWMAVVYAGIVLIPPFSAAFVALLAIGSWYARRDVIVWIAVPFVLAHAMLARKEARFLIPLLYILGPWLAVCLDRLPAHSRATLGRWRRTAIGRLNIAAFCAVNLLVLSVAIVLPGNDSIRLDQWLWEYGRQPRPTIYAWEGRIIGVPDKVTNSFYRSDVAIVPFTSLDQLPAAGAASPVFVYHVGAAPAALTAKNCTPVLRTYPAWLTGLPAFTRLTNIQPASVCRLDAPP
jgi:GPI mannosyltransferase 3